MTHYIDEAKKLIAGEEAGVRYRDPLEATGFAQINHALTYWQKLSSDAYRLYAAYRSLVDIGDHVISNDAIAKLLGWGVTKLKDNKAELISLGLITCEKTAFSGASVIYIEPLGHIEEVNQIAKQFTEARNERMETRLRYRANRPQSRPIEAPNEPQSRPIEASNKPQLRPHIRKEDSEEEGEREKKLSPAPSSGRRGVAVPKTGYREEPERVAVGDENGNERNDARAQNGLERYILRQCQGNPQYLSPTNRRKLLEPIYVYKGKAQIEEPSPLLEWERDSEGFEEWVGTVANYVGGKGNRPTLAKLIQAIRNNYDAEGWGWLAVRANDLPVDDPSQPWNQ